MAESERPVGVLGSFVVFLRPREVAPLSSSTGRSVHALFLNLLRDVDAGLSEQLHADVPIKPFTVSALRGRFARRDGTFYVTPEATYDVRFTTLSDPVFAAVNAVLGRKQTAREPITLDGYAYDITKVSLGAKQSRGWGSQASYRGLVDAAQPESRIAFEFASPTAFHQGDQYLLFPLPVTVFRSLLQRWQALSPLRLKDDGLTDFVAEQVVAERYKLETRATPYGTSIVPGFVGTCRYRVLHEDPFRLRLLHILADFALFSGLGQKTAQGMGQARRV